MAKKEKEPMIGISSLRMVGKESTVKAFVDIIVPTNDFGDMTIRNFKVIDAGKGLFVALPTRPIKSNNRKAMNIGTGEVSEGSGNETQYINDLRFENQDMFNGFRDELQRVIIPAVKDKMKQ